MATRGITEEIVVQKVVKEARAQAVDQSLRDSGNHVEKTVFAEDASPGQEHLRLLKPPFRILCVERWQAKRCIGSSRSSRSGDGTTLIRHDRRRRRRGVSIQQDMLLLLNNGRGRRRPRIMLSPIRGGARRGNRTAIGSPRVSATRRGGDSGARSANRRGGDS